MSKVQNIFIGLDIGNKHCKCIIFGQNKNEPLKILKFGQSLTKGLQNNSIIDYMQFQTCIKTCIESTKIPINIKKCQIISNLPLPESENCLEKSRNQSIFTHQPYDLDNKNMIYSENLNNIKKELIDTLKIFTIYPVHFIYEGISIHDYALNQYISKTPIYMIDMGYKSSKIHLYKDNKLQERRLLEIGGQTITNDLKICLDTTQDTAEKLKILNCNLNSSNEKKTIKINNQEYDNQLIQKIVASRVTEWANLLNISHPEYPILLTGSSALLKGKARFLKKKFNFNVTLLDPKSLKPSSEKIAFTNCISHILYAKKYDLFILGKQTKPSFFTWLKNTL